ncbi:histidine kinase [Salinibius halmophilus]|uniref:histidine kinase n=1 Tax=Salinibius halmophilus TaxID=1853216 RepID=UPI000E668EAF|nr:histidine kinase [Salinibius halmophilus]
MPLLSGLTQQGQRLHQWLLGPNNQYDWLPYLWLSYMAVYFAPLFIYPMPTWQRTLLIIAGILVLALYFASQRLANAWLVAAMLGIGTAVCFIYAGGVVLMFYGASMAAFVTHKRHSYYLFGLYSLCAAVVTAMVSLPPFVLFVLWTALLWGIGNLVHRRNDLKNLSLKLSQAEAQAIARLQERERIRGDIHDLLGQSLTTISLNMQVLARAELDAASKQQLIQQTDQLAKQCLQDARNTLHNNYQASIEEVLASSRIACLARGIELRVSGQFDDLSEKQSHALAQALRESITNSIKHSQASQIIVQLRRHKQIELRIADNGGGHPAQLGTGLTGLKARIEQLGGVVEFSQGWTTLICMPVNEAGDL